IPSTHILSVVQIFKEPLTKQRRSGIMKKTKQLVNPQKHSNPNALHFPLQPRQPQKQPAAEASRAL
ncbi:hypothetical protein, partial [Azoarcus taiwanensis]|uniref:hypothetical protein n=1 Tax=Azoarcus taiwanensis TaxID=666964 RepID=UPI001B7D218C